MKKLTLITLLFVLFLGTRCQALENAKATFFGKHACVSAGANISSCEIHWGDTLSRFARRSDSNIKTLMGLNPSIVKPNLIYAYTRITIPNTSLQASETTMRATSIMQSSMSVDPVVESSSMMMATEDDYYGLPLMEAFESAPVQISVTSPDTTQSSVTAPAPTSAKAGDNVTASESGLKITGYKLVIPQSVAVAMGGIPLKCSLKTEVLSYASDEAKAHNAPDGYFHLRNSWAQKEGDTIVLYVPKDLPKKPFNLFIAGVHDPIDGKTFMENAEGLQGKFPGPHKIGRRIFSTLMIGANGYMLASTLGPIAGPSVMGGMLITRAILKHHAETTLRKAEDKFNETLAGGKTPSSEKELGQ